MRYSSDELEKLIWSGCETRVLDHKSAFEWSCCKKTQIGLVKDLMAMANSELGGLIVVGVRDGDYQPTGLSDKELKSFDQTKLHDFLMKYTDGEVSFELAKPECRGKKFVVIDIPESRNIPVICKQDFQDPDDPRRLILRSADIYIRTNGASSERITRASDARNLIDRAVSMQLDKILKQWESAPRKKTLKSKAQKTKRVVRYPVANAGENRVGYAGEPILFDGGASKGKELCYSWNFGDGQTSNQRAAVHEYKKPGLYKVVLTVWEKKNPDRKSSSGFMAVARPRPLTTALRNQDILAKLLAKYPGLKPIR